MIDNLQNDINKQIQDISNPGMRVVNMQKLSDEMLLEEKNKEKLKEAVLDSKLEEFRKQVKEVLHKEENYENMLLSQQRDMMDFEDKKIREQQSYEIANATKMIQDIQSISEHESIMKIKRKRAMREMQDTMLQVQNQIADKRKNLVDKLKNMRMVHELKKRKSVKDLLNEKKELGKKFAKLSKLGNPLACFNKNDMTYISSYCRTNIPDIEIQNECIKPSQFCYICCDNEIGVINKTHLDCCYNKCDNIPQASCMNYMESFSLSNYNGISAPMITPTPPIPISRTPVLGGPELSISTGSPLLGPDPIVSIIDDSVHKSH